MSGRLYANGATTISAKKPDNPINKFKLNFINQTLQNTNKVLGDAYLPFPDFP